MRTTNFLFIIISLFFFSCSKNADKERKNNFNNDNDTISFKSKKDYNLFFKNKMDNEEIDSCKNNYKNLKITGLTNKFTLDYNKFYNLIMNNYSLYDDCEFYFIQENGILNLGLVLNSPKKTAHYIFNGNEFVIENNLKNFSNLKNKFVNDINETIKQKTKPKNNTTQYISYKMKDILGFLLIINQCQISLSKLDFDMLLFREYKDKNNIQKKYDDSKRERISFAVSPVYKTPTFYYDAGDLKP